MTNRYQDLLAKLPAGGWYKSKGAILPACSGAYTYVMPTQAALAGHVFGIFIDGSFVRTATADVNGTVTVETSDSSGRTLLPPGDHVIEIVDGQDTSRRYRSFITTRTWATWLAAHADVLDSIDQENADLALSLSLSTATASYLDELYGRLVVQRNASYTTEGFRNVVQSLRQAYRLWAARPAGRRALGALAGVSPFQVPQAWRPSWAPADDETALPPATVLLDEADGGADPFPLLNARTLDWVAPAFTDDFLLAPMPYQVPYTPQRLSVTFDGAWAGGDVVITGVDGAGLTQTDTFLAAPATTVAGAITFVTVTAIRSTSAGPGTGTASVGLTETRFLRLKATRGPLAPTGAALAHTLAATATDLQLDGGALVALPPSDATLTLVIGGEFGYRAAARLPGVAVATGAVAYTAEFLWVALDNRNVFRARLPASPASLASIASAVNAGAAHEESLGALPARGTITIAVPGSITNGDTITVTDVLGQSAVFEAASSSNPAVVGSGHIPYDKTGTATQVRDALLARFNRAGIYLRGVASGSAVITVYATLAGANVNPIAVVQTVPGAITATGLALGADADATNYATPALVLSGVAGDVLELHGGDTTTGADNAVAVHPHPVDAALPILGFPRAATTTTASATVGTTALAVAATATLPSFPTVVVKASQAATVGAFASFTQPDWPTPIEAWFSPDYNGTGVTIDGVDSDGRPAHETLAYPGPTIIDASTAPGADGRRVESPGVLATTLVATADGANAQIRIYNAHAAGTAGNTWTVNVVVPGASVTLLASIAGTILTIRLATDSGGVPISTGNDVVAAIEASTDFLAAATGTGATVWTAASAAASPYSFSGGLDDGVVLSIAQDTALDPSRAFGAEVRVGMYFRFTEGPHSSVLRRIVAVGASQRNTGAPDADFPPVGYIALAPTRAPYTTNVWTRRIVLSSSIGGSFAPADWAWEVIDAAIVQSTVVFASLTAGVHGVGTTGRFQLRIADGVADYGVPVIVGRGSRSNGTDGVLASMTAGLEARFTAASGAPRGDDQQGILRVTGSTFWAGANNGLHRIELDPNSFSPLITGLALRLAHDDASRGQIFNQKPTSLTNWSSFSNETGLTWRLYSAGETVLAVGVPSATTLTLAEPGLTVAKISGALVEVQDNMPATRASVATGLDQLELEVITALRATATDTVTAQQRVLPDGWRAYNLASGRYALWGDTSDLRLRLQASAPAVAGQGLTLELPLYAEDGIKGLRGRPVNAYFWMEQCYSASPVTWRIDASYDLGATWVAGSTTAVPYSVTDTSTDGRGGGRSTPVRATLDVPTDAQGLAVRLVPVAGNSAGDRIFLEQVIIAPAGAAYYLGHSTVARQETQTVFSEVLYAWCASAAGFTMQERADLGLPDTAIGNAPNALTTTRQGHIDRLVNAHGYWERADVTDGSNVRGCFSSVQWFSATLTNLEVVPESPGRLSWLRPVQPSIVRAAPLVVVGPSNATLPGSDISRREALPFPQAPSDIDTLYEDGVPVPSTAFPGTRSSASIGTHPPNGRVLLTSTRPGAGADGFSVTVDATLTTDRPLTATWTPATAALVVRLAVLNGALETARNRATIVAQAVGASGAPIAAVVDPTGTGAGVLDAAEGPTAFAGGQALPWRWLNATSLQLASVAAGDPPESAQYYTGFVPRPSGQLVYNPAAAYTLDYERLTRAETPVIDLGAFHDDYLWLVDAVMFRRDEPELYTRTRTTALSFRTNNTAILAEPAVRDASLATLTQDNGLVRFVLAARQWSFLDSRTIQLAPGVFDSTAVYTLEYPAESARFPRVPKFVLEHRAATSAIALMTTPYVEVALDAPVGRPTTGALRYHQLRLTLENVTDTRDIRVQSLGLRGIHLFGATPHAPGVEVE